jgi:hypothetical protein
LRPRTAAIFAMVIGAILLLGACGGATSSYPSVEAMKDTLAGDKRGCESLAKVDPADPTNQISAKAPSGSTRFVTEAAVCETPGGRLQMFTFSDTETRDRWLAFTERLGAPIVLGEDWAVLAPSPEGAAEVQDSLGGEILDPQA